MAESADPDLNNCDREPIRIPGRIQAHGCMLACDAQMRVVLHASENFSAFFEFADESVVGRTLAEIFGSEAAHSLVNIYSRNGGTQRAALAQSIALGPQQKRTSAACHKSGDNVILEFEPAPPKRHDGPLDIARLAIARISDLGAIDEIAAQTPRILRALFGYDRAMVYKFAQDGSGEVIAESRRAGLESFMGQHFPAGDIPKQARQLYIANTIRVIGDIRAPTVALSPTLDKNGAPVDMSFAHLRSVSPIHIEYLQIMGVGASMSISIVVGGELWGLIACHHYSANLLNMPQRIAAELFGDFFSLKIESLLNRKRLEAASHARRILDDFLRDGVNQEDLITYLRNNLEKLKELLAFDGIGLLIDGIWASYGRAPPAAAMSTLMPAMAARADGRVWSTDHLGEIAEGAGEYAHDAAGALVVPCSNAAKDFMIFFRSEQVRSVQWAGDPNKSYESGPLGDRLTPRKSFAIWKELVSGQSHPWTESDLSIAEITRIQLIEIILRSTEIRANERQKSDIRQKILHEELNHRVKNILSLISSIVMRPQDGSTDINDYVAILKGRIQALAYAHDQVIRNDGGGVLDELLKAELSPYGDSSRTILMSGPRINMDARAFSVLALVIHEMATNAAKYGALSVSAGGLNVHWSIEESGDCVIQWTETGGPRVEAPAKRGFGSILLQRSVTFDLGGEAEIKYPPEGFKARFVIPANFVRSVEAAAQSAAASAAEPQTPRTNLLDSGKVLLVEDQLIIALHAEDLLAEAGAGEVLTAATVVEAIRMLSQNHFDCAVLDVNLGSENSLMIAAKLHSSGIPFVFATGYGDTTIIPADLRHVPVVRKPYTLESLTNGLRQTLCA